MRYGQKDKGLGHILFIILALVVVGVIAAAWVFVKKGGVFSVINSGVASDAPDCGAEPLLKYSPVKPEEISTIVPLGNLAPPGHVLPTTHMYYNYVDEVVDGQNVPKLTTLYVPVDIIVTKIMKSNNADLPIAYDSYRVDFTICKDVIGYVILIQKLNDKLAAIMQPPYDRSEESDVGKSNKTRNDYKDVNIKLSAGEVFGYAGGKVGDPDGLDFAIIDFRVAEPTLANSDRWPESERHYVCTLDYYSAETSALLYSKIGDFGGQLVDPGDPKCGTVYQDQPGTAQGVWIRSDAAGLWDVKNVVALVHSNYDHSKGAFSFGNGVSEIGLSTSQVMLFSPTSEGIHNRDFDEVKNDGNIYCYDTDLGNNTGSGQSVLVQMIGEDQLRIGPTLACGKGPWDFDKYLDYIR